MESSPKSQQTVQGYFYNRQIKRYIGAFMAIFAGIKIQTGAREDGATRFIDVPVAYGSKDRVAAAALADNTQNALVRLPMMSAYMRSLTLAPNRMKGQGIERTSTYVPQGGILPDDIVSLKQRMPVPYDMGMELCVYTTNMDTHCQILEQIMMLFDPSVEIERSDGNFDWAKNIVVTIDDVDFDENYPAMADRRKLQTNIRFTMPIWIESPASYKNDVVKTVKLRIQAMSDLADFMESVAIAQDSDYDVVATTDALTGVVD